MADVEIYNKLVRDRIPEIIVATGKRPTCETLSEDEYKSALVSKFFEEVEEFRLADTPVKVIEELTDIYEVMLAILTQHGISQTDFERLRLSKRAKRGGFERRIFLKSTQSER